MPNSSREPASTEATPLTHVSSDIPRDRWACGSSMISACLHPGERRPGQVGPGHVREVLLRLQHGHVGVVQVQEGLQVRELVARAQLLQVRVGQFDPVAFRQREDQLRFQRSFNMQVQFRDREREGFTGLRFFRFLPALSL